MKAIKFNLENMSIISDVKEVGKVLQEAWKIYEYVKIIDWKIKWFTRSKSIFKRR